MITASGNQGRVRRKGPSSETGLQTVGLTRHRLGRVWAHLSFRERRAAADALVHERRRVAADIHDLIMQDLSLALANARAMAEASEPVGQAGVVVAAAERALAGAREVVQGLTRPQQSVAVVEAVEAGVRDAARDAVLSFDAKGVPACDQPDRLTLDVLVHVGREAVTNAVKHSGSRAHVEVVFAHDEEWRLTVRDRGRRLGSAGSTSTGFGLESMRARVSGLGGTLHVSDTLGKGTVVEAVLP